MRAASSTNVTAGGSALSTDHTGKSVPKRGGLGKVAPGRRIELIHRGELISLVDLAARYRLNVWTVYDRYRRGDRGNELIRPASARRMRPNRAKHPLARAVIDYIDDKGLQYNHLADRAGYNREFISVWKRGAKIPSLHALCDILEAAGGELVIVDKVDKEEENGTNQEPEVEKDEQQD